MTTVNAASTDTSAAVAAQDAHVAPEKGTSKKGASPKKGAPTSQKRARGGKPKAAAAKPKRASATKAAKKVAKPKADGPREGSKTALVVAMLQRKNGAALVEIMDKMGWQKHTVRGFMAGAMKKAGYTVESFKSDKGDRTYRINQ
jgi:hypothetical protein